MDRGLGILAAHPNADPDRLAVSGLSGGGWQTIVISALDRRVALVGRSMRKYLNIAKSLNHMDVPEGILIQPREIDQFPEDKITILSTGSQGEPLSALRRMAHVARTRKVQRKAPSAPTSARKHKKR